MAWINKFAQRCYALVLVSVLACVLAGCSVKYSFQGGTLDYSRVRTISIADITNRAPIIYPSLAPLFTERLKNFYSSRTRLEQVPRDGDLDLECTITGYDLSTGAVGADNYASRTTFTVTIQVKYTNSDNPKEGFDNKSFKAYRDFDRSEPFVAVQDRLLDEIIEDLIKQIFNATVENW